MCTPLPSMQKPPCFDQFIDHLDARPCKGSTADSNKAMAELMESRFPDSAVLIYTQRDPRIADSLARVRKDAKFLALAECGIRTTKELRIHAAKALIDRGFPAGKIITDFDGTTLMGSSHKETNTLIGIVATILTRTLKLYLREVMSCAGKAYMLCDGLELTRGEIACKVRGLMRHMRFLEEGTISDIPFANTAIAYALDRCFVVHAEDFARINRNVVALTATGLLLGLSRWKSGGFSGMPDFPDGICLSEINCMFPRSQ